MPVIGFEIGHALDLGTTPAPILDQSAIDTPSLVYTDGLGGLPENDTGTDVSLLTPIAGSWPVLGGDKMLAEQTIRRITTPRGTLDFSPNDGIDVRDYLRVDMDTTDVFNAKQAIESELLKDERFDDVSVSATFNPPQTSQSDANLQLTMTMTKGQGGFQLVTSVTQLTVDVLSAESV